MALDKKSAVKNVDISNRTLPSGCDPLHERHSSSHAPLLKHWQPIALGCHRNP
ncbi:hypothetical protein [Aggregatibacter segnis]|uniref:hypothetical protein n=1 Tax=Aggregatibacter segnis TaxID=739 RepID=UPI0028E88319|nr:hypothetical protein [Aggregatibacter segnis]